MTARREFTSPWWVPSLYFAEGVPAAVVCEVALVVLLGLGMSNARVAFWTGLFGMAWVVKPLWAPLVDIFGAKRRWIVITELWLGMAFAACGAAYNIGSANFLLAGFALAALLSATHDIAADGFYVIALDSHRQSIYSGVRSAAYRGAMVCAGGGLMMLAGGRDSVAGAWGAVLMLPGGLFVLLALYHGFVLPRPEGDRRLKGADNGLGAIAREFLGGFVSFFGKANIFKALIFILFYRFAEALVSTVSRLFLLGGDGLALGVREYGFIAGTVGVAAMLLGGVLGGVWAAKTGFRRALIPLMLALNVPNLVYVALAFYPTGNLWVIGGAVAVEQFGYGLGYTALMLFMVWYASTGESYRTSHFALMTGLTILGVRLPGMLSGWFLDSITGIFPCGLNKFQLFFIVVMICTVPCGAITFWVRGIIPGNFGRREP